MKKIELDEEEMKLVNEFRQKKFIEAQEKIKLQNKKSQAEKLEIKFKEVLNIALKEINQHLERADEELKLAEAVSEKHGIPFTSSISNLYRHRQYIPRSFFKKWNEIDPEVAADELDMYINESDIGWEYWDSSSLNC